jgi:hypothetical protein
MPEKMVPEHRFGLRPFEKELPGRRSGVFRYKNPAQNTPSNNISIAVGPAGSLAGKRLLL